MGDRLGTLQACASSLVSGAPVRRIKVAMRECRAHEGGGVRRLVEYAVEFGDEALLECGGIAAMLDTLVRRSGTSSFKSVPGGCCQSAKKVVSRMAILGLAIARSSALP